MSFIILGLICVIVGVIFFRLAIKSHDKEGKYGSIGLIAAGVILVMFFGIFYRYLTLFTT